MRCLQPVVDRTGIRRHDLDPRFSGLSDEDLVTAGAYVQFAR
jgi:hypothetical protein